MANANRFMVRILDSDQSEGIIHDAFKRIEKGYSSYPIFEHLLCSKTYVSVNLSTERFAEILQKMLHRYFGEGKIISIDEYYRIIKFNRIEVHVYVSPSNSSQTMTKFSRELYKVVNTIL